MSNEVVFSFCFRIPMTSSVVLILILIFTLALSHARRNDLVFGKEQIGDEMYEEIVHEPKKWGRKLKFVKEIVPVFENTPIRNINKIQAWDQDVTGHGGKVRIIDIKNGMVTMEFESERSQGIHFIIEIYGK